MMIKITLICLAFALLVVGSSSENPGEKNARVGKFLGWLAVEGNNAAPLKLFVSTDRRWKGELSLTFGRRPLIASAEFFYYNGRRKPHQPVQYEHNVLLQSDVTSGTSHDTKPLSETSASDMHRDVTEETPLESTEETTQVTARALKLEDYDEITFNAGVDVNRVKREATQIERAESKDLKAGDDAEDGTDSTTVESSTISMKMQEQESTDNNFVTLPPTTDATSHHTYHYVPSTSHFPYPPSRNPSAQHVTITYSPPHQPMKNFYDFYPSQPQPDNNLHSFAPYCINSIQPKYTPTMHDAWSYYRQWK